MRLVLILIAFLLSTPASAYWNGGYAGGANGICSDHHGGWVRCGTGQHGERISGPPNPAGLCATGRGRWTFSECRPVRMR